MMEDNCNDGFCEVTPVVAEQHVEEETASSGKLLYITDPMCSWCWGFSEVFKKVRAKYESVYDIEIILGGLRLGGGDPWNQKTKSYLDNVWNVVSKRTGQEISHNLLNRPHFNYDTEPPSRATIIVRAMEPDKVWEFFERVQKKFYQDNQDPGEIEFYREICGDLQIDFDEFTTKFNHTYYRQLVLENHQTSAMLGVRGFPTLLLIKSDNSINGIAAGFQEWETVDHRITNA